MDSHFSFSTNFMMSLSFDVENAKNKFECLKQQAIETTFNRRWSSLIHFMALSSVLQIPIFSVYPDISPAVRALCHGLIKPREVTEKSGIWYIMFTRDTLDSTKGTCFEPNHFCPLIPDTCNTLPDKPLQGFLFDINDFPPPIPSPTALTWPSLSQTNSNSPWSTTSKSRKKQI